MVEIMQLLRKTLGEIVSDQDLSMLERFCLQHKTYSKVIEIAKALHIDLDELEELLRKI